MTEEQLQVECFEWFWNNFQDQRRMLWHNNNNAHNAIAGNKNKARGVVKGVADFTLVASFMVVFIEIKIGTGKQSTEQVDFQNKVIQRGHQYHLIYSFVEFKNLIWRIIGRS